jgi:hypothetical protein
MTGVAVTVRRSNQAQNAAAISSRAAVWLTAAALTAAWTGAAIAQATPAPAPAVAGTQAAPAPAAPQPAPTATPKLVLPPQPPPPGLTEVPAEKRGFLNGFGKWWDQSIADWKAKMKAQQSQIDAFNKQSADAAKDAAAATQQAMKNAADALRPSHVIEIQQLCPVAGNGAADCATAATSICKAKGFSTGQPLDVRTAEKCADSLWVSGQTPTAADCPVETVLLRAACQ